MKRKLFFISICCLIAATSSAQFLIGFTAGIGGYQWDKSPAGSETKTTGGIFSEIIGLNVGVGNETCRLVLEGYEDYAPFTFSVKEFQGMGTFSAGAMGKLSFTFGDWSSTRKGFSLGAGVETSRTEMHFRKKEVERDWYPTKYGYVAYSTLNENDVQADFFAKVGVGSHSVMRMEVGLRLSYYAFF
jgi:hypothetical protein